MLARDRKKNDPNKIPESDSKKRDTKTPVNVAVIFG